MNIQRNPVGWFEIYVQDMNRARRFYERVLKLSLNKLESPVDNIEMWAFPGGPESPGACGALATMPEKDSGTGGTIIYFSCIDCAEQGSLAASAGGMIHLPKTPIGEYGFISLIYDTEGNMIGLHSMK